MVLFCDPRNSFIHSAAWLALLVRFKVLQTCCGSDHVWT